MSSPPRAVYRPSVTAPPLPPPEPPWRRDLRRFVQRHGWRAYALPVLVVVTIAGLATLGGGKTPKTEPVAQAPVTSTVPTVQPSSTAPTSIKVDPTQAGAEELPSDALPPGAAFTSQGTGTFTPIAGTTAVIGSGTVRKYVIEAENGITGVDLNTFAARVVASLDDARSWTGGTHSVALQRVATEAEADFRVALTTPVSLRPICGYDIKVETSCWDNLHGPSRVYLNLARWVRGDTSFGQDLATYRLYMINHEVGHALGHVHTFTCLPNGLAPVMLQQTLTLKENQGAGPKICSPNPWPYPSGVAPSIAVPS